MLIEKELITISAMAGLTIKQNKGRENLFYGLLLFIFWIIYITWHQNLLSD